MKTEKDALIIKKWIDVSFLKKIWTLLVKQCIGEIHLEDNLKLCFTWIWSLCYFTWSITRNSWKQINI